MINGNSYQALTHNGITQLFSPTFQRQEFILQVIQVNSLSEASCDIFLSDGFAFLKGQLVGDARIQALKAGMTVYSILRFIVDDIQINQTTFQLNKCLDINTKIHSIIGKPVPYKDLSKKKDFIDFGSANRISSKRTISLKEVKQMPAGKIAATILAKVTKKPVKINTVMNIVIEDEEHQQIQCCFFGDSVPKYKDMIQYGQWYRFQDPVLQINNKFGNILQLKINNQSKITKQNSTQVKPGIINHNNNNNYSNNPPKEIQKKAKQVQPLKQFIMKDYQGRDNVQQFDIFVIARPLKIFVMKNDMGRSCECVNRFGEIMEIVLWKDCSFEISVGQTYKFESMKVKIFRQKLSVQSQRSKTQITSSTLKILSRDQYFGEKKQERKTFGNGTSFRGKRYLGSNDIVYSLGEMIEKSQKSKQKSLIIICCGYLTIKFDYMGGSASDGYSELRKKLFYVHCQKCESNEYLRAKIEVENMNGKVVCNSCKSQTVRIMWNIKATFMDSQTQIPCKINSQIADKLIEMTPSEGMLLYLQDHEKLKCKIQKKINFKRGVFKFSCKPTQKQTYYNICEFYEEGNKIFAQRSTNQLKRTFASFIKFRNGATQSITQSHQHQEMELDN